MILLIIQLNNNLFCSVYQFADPDSGKYRIRILYPQKDPCNSNFFVIKLSKIHFRQNNFLIFDLKCYKMFSILVQNFTQSIDSIFKTLMNYLGMCHYEIEISRRSVENLMEIFLQK